MRWIPEKNMHSFLVRSYERKGNFDGNNYDGDTQRREYANAIKFLKKSNLRGWSLKYVSVADQISD